MPWAQRRVSTINGPFNTPVNDDTIAVLPDLLWRLGLTPGDIVYTVDLGYVGEIGDTCDRCDFDHYTALTRTCSAHDPALPVLGKRTTIVIKK
jgi:hypothetical protein